MGERRLWAAAVALSLALHLRAAYLGPAWQVYVFKPLTTAVIIAFALASLRHGRSSPRYALPVLAGLACSLAGDVLLMLPSNQFVAGLVAFLLAHLCYLGAFVRASGARTTPGVFVPFALYVTVLLAVLLPRAGSLALPMIVYAVALGAMGWQAAERWYAARTTAAAAAAVGAVFFVLSDSALAIDRFVTPFHAAPSVVMTTYILAQWLIATSIDDEFGRLSEERMS